MMNCVSYLDAQSLLEDIQDELESNEAANSLMLGLCGQLARHPEQYTTNPCLKTVDDENGLVLAAIMTPPHRLIVYHHQGNLKAGARILVEELVREGWQVPGVLGPRQVARAVAERWEEATQKSFRPGQRQRVYEMREVLLPPPERGRLRLATEAEFELVTRWWLEFNREIFGQADLQEARKTVQFRIQQGNVFLWDDSGPVSMATKNRPTRNGITVSMVYTPPELRRKGYARACVAELSRMLLAAGRQHCALFTDLSNPTSNHIYQEIGYQPVCDYDEYVFL